MHALSFSLVLSFAVVAVAQTPPPAPAQDPAPAKKLDEAKWDHFGAGITAGAATPLAEVLKQPEAFTGKPVRIEAPITAVCQTKGCWMHLGSQQPPVMVKFKDYGFFVPLDSKGARVRAEGVATVKTLSKKEADHLVEEGAKLLRNEDGTAREVSFVASGVELTK